MFILLLCKHLIVDFILQTPYMFMNKGTFMHPGGLLHAGLHGITTMLILSSVSVWGAVVAGTADAVLHYFIDFAKVNINKKFGLEPSTACACEPWQAMLFWWMVGIDQFLHMLTYVVILLLMY